MGWNENLYYYAQTRGGEYFGGDPQSWYVCSGWDAMLLLEHKGQPMVVRCQTIPGGRGADGHRVQVLLRCELERDYRLSISPRSKTRQGINLVLDALDKGVQRLGPDVDLYRDYGFPEVTAGRSIKTSQPEFTQMVFRDLDFRRALLDNPRYGVLVEQSAPDCMPGPMHQVAAWCDLGGLDNLYADWGMEAGEPYADLEEQRKKLEDSAFPQKLDALIGLAKAARGAVMAWRMPEKRIDK